MGHYYGCATRLRVKKTATPQVINFVDYLFGLSETVPPAPRNQAQADLAKATETIHGMLGGMGSYFETMKWAVKEDKGDHWLYESRTSTRNVSHDLLAMLLNGISESLLLEDGDILHHSVYEESATETVTYAVQQGDGFQFQKRDGWSFESDHGFVIDSSHPYNARLSAEEKAAKSADFAAWASTRHEDCFDWSWKIQELDTRVKKEKEERHRALMNRHPWS